MEEMRMYILEEMKTREELQELVKNPLELMEAMKDSEIYTEGMHETLKSVVEYNMEQLKNYPTGKWVGIVSKCDLDEFKQVAMGAIQASRNEGKIKEYRVLRYEVLGDFWDEQEYVNPVEFKELLDTIMRGVR